MRPARTLRPCRPALLIAWALLAALLAPPARAQLFPGSSLLAPTGTDDAPTIDLLLPFRLDRDAADDGIPAERFIPMTVLIGPGNAGGFMTVEYAQDATQNAMTVVPFAATPDLAVPITVVGAFPVGLDRITITLYDGAANTVIRRSVFSAMPAANEQPLPFSPTADIGLVGIVGDPTIAGAVATIRDNAGLNTPDAQLATARFAPDQLPAIAMGYDALETLVVRSSDTRRIAPRTVIAIRQWVDAGGWLVLIADDPATQWRSWLPPGEVGDLVRLAEPLPGTPGRALTTLLAGPESVPPTLSRRTITLAPRAVADGWSGKWGTDAGLLHAQGPVGLGMVTITAIDPGRAFPAASSSRLADAWLDALQGPIERYRALMPREGDQAIMRRLNPWGATPSGAGLAEQHALSTAIERLAQIPPLGHGMFIMIAASVLALALLVGPVDALVLKKLRIQHRSWLTAIAWIALATLAAYSAPYLVKSGPTRVGRAVALDLIVDPAGGNTLARSSAGHGVGITTIFAAAPLRSALDGIDERSWWRGVSTAMYMPNAKRSFSPLTTIQMLSSPNAGSPPPQGPVLSMGLWTLRAMLDRGPIDAPISATITRDDQSRDDQNPDASYTVRIVGLPKDLSIQWSELRTAPSDTRALVMERDKQGDYTGRTARIDAPAPTTQPPGLAKSNAASAFNLTYARTLPGAIRRTASIDRRITSPRWAVIELMLTRETRAVRPDHPAAGPWTVPGPSLEITADHALELAIRLLVPIDPSDPPPPVAGRDQPQENPRD